MSDSDDYSEYSDEYHSDESEDEPLVAAPPPAASPKQQPQPSPNRSPIAGFSGRAEHQSSATPASLQTSTFSIANSLKVDLGLTDEQREVFWQRRKRWQDLQAELRLRLTTFHDDIYEAAPVSEAQMFAAGRGRFSAQVSSETQTSGLCDEQDTQTDAVLTAVGRCQAPRDLKEELAKRVQASVSRAQLAAAPCLQKAGDRPSAIAADTGLSTSAGTLTWHLFLAGRPVTCTAFPHVAKPLLAVSYGSAAPEAPVTGALLGLARQAPSRAASHLAQSGCVVLWDLSSPSTPTMVLPTESKPTCCAWGPASCSHVVLAGAEDGSLYAWDLREPERMHGQSAEPAGSVPTRMPTYSTSHLAPSQSGASSVVALAVLDRSAAPAAGEFDASFDLLSLSAWGGVTSWTVLSSSEADMTGRGTEADNGLRFGGCIRLVQVSARLPTTLRPAAGMNVRPRRCFAVACPADGASNVLIGSDAGAVLKAACYGALKPPLEYRTQEVTWLPGAKELRDNTNLGTASSFRASPSNVVSLSAHPTIPALFLAGHDVGTVALHSTARALALMTWHDVTAMGNLLAAVWSTHRPAVFLAVGRSAVVRVFDLCKDTSWAVATFQIRNDSMLTSARLSQRVMSQGGLDTPVLALGRKDGGVQYHILGSMFKASDEPEEGAAVRRMFDIR